jgi:hypothetical protein
MGNKIGFGKWLWKGFKNGVSSDVFKHLMKLISPIIIGFSITILLAIIVYNDLRTPPLWTLIPFTISFIMFFILILHNIYLHSIGEIE